MVDDFSKLPLIPNQYAGIHKQYCSESTLVTPNIYMLEDAYKKAYKHGDKKPVISAYNDWIDYLALTRMIYGSVCIKKLIIKSHLRADCKCQVLRDLDYNDSSKSVRDFGRYVLTALYGYHARVINNMLESVAQDAADNEIDYEQLYDELFLIIKTCKPVGFDDILWEQYVWSYA